MYLVHQMAPYGVYLLLMQETKQEIKSIFLISSPRRTLYSLSAAVPVLSHVASLQMFAVIVREHDTFSANLNSKHTVWILIKHACWNTAFKLKWINLYNCFITSLFPRRALH